MTLKILLVLTSLLFIVDGELECSNRGAKTREADFTMDSKKTDVYKYALCEFEALPAVLKNDLKLVKHMLGIEYVMNEKVTRKLLALADIVKDLRKVSKLKGQVDAQTRELLETKIKEKFRNLW